MQVPFAQVLGRFTQKKAPGEVATPWELFFLVYRMEYPHNSIFSICHSPQKSSVAQKVYKPALSVTPAACHLSQRERLWQAGRRKKAPFRRLQLREGVFPLGAPMAYLLFLLLLLLYAIPRKSQASHRKFTETAAQRLSISFSPAFLSGCRTASGASLSGTWGF